MKLCLTIFVFLAMFNKLEGKADYDIYDKYRQLIKSQGLISWKPCTFGTDITNNFRESLYNVTIKTFKKVATVSHSHFVFSPHSLYLALSALAEGSSGQTREELFNFLLLPQDECLRNLYYHYATTLELPGEDVKLARSTSLIIDDGVNVNAYWDNFARTNSLLQTNSAPIKSDPLGAANLIRKNFKLQMPASNFEGNSILVDTLDYEGLWTYAFSDAIVERAPFYNDEGKKTGYVDLMKIKRRIKMAYLPTLNMKVLELPVGFGGRYQMLISMSLGRSDVKRTIPGIMNSVFFDILDGLKESIIPLEVAMPRFRMTTEVDMRKVLEEMGVSALWNDFDGTRNISEPAALPSSFIQRTTVTFDTTGVRAPIQEVNNIIPTFAKGSAQELDTGLEPILGRDFIMDRPFLFGLIDSKTYTCLFCSAFYTPTYQL